MGSKPAARISFKCTNCIGLSFFRVILTRSRSPTFRTVPSVTGSPTSPVLVCRTKVRFFSICIGLSFLETLSISSKYCQYRPPQAAPGVFLLRCTFANDGITSDCFHVVLKYPVPASGAASSNVLISNRFPPICTATASLIPSQSVPLSNKAWTLLW